MKQLTEQNLINAFGTESMAYTRYLHYAVQADKENYPNVARLFRAVSHAEHIHASRSLRAAQAPGSADDSQQHGSFWTRGNPEKPDLSHLWERHSKFMEMYPAYMEIAKLQEEKDAFRSFEWSYKTEKMHLESP